MFRLVLLKSWSLTSVKRDRDYNGNINGISIFVCVFSLRPFSKVETKYHWKTKFIGFIGFASVAFLRQKPHE